MFRNGNHRQNICEWRGTFFLVRGCKVDDAIYFYHPTKRHKDCHKSYKWRVLPNKPFVYIYICTYAHPLTNPSDVSRNEINKYIYIYIIIQAYIYIYMYMEVSVSSWGYTQSSSIFIQWMVAKSCTSWWFIPLFNIVHRVSTCFNHPMKVVQDFAGPSTL